MIFVFLCGKPPFMMKKLLLAAAALLLALAAQAQGTKHLSFEGISLEGEYNTFTQIMRRNGFRFASKDKQEPFMRGKVLGEQADVTILVTPKTYQVYMIMVSYPQRTGWETLKNQYDSMKMKMFARYGEPQMCVEQFSSPLAENNPIAALEHGNCTFVSNYQVPGGEIIMSLSKDARVQLYYMDAEGMKLANAEQ